MGCFGALAALRTAESIAQSNPSHRVLVVCAELCSLHIQKEELRFDNLVAAAIFGDGAAAVIIGASQPSHLSNKLFEIVRTSCYAIADSEEKIRWDLSDSGWRVGLAPDIASIFNQVLPPFCESLVQNESSFAESQWAIHPGGKSVVEVIEKSFELKKEQTVSTWNVLEQKGNMSSGTILFILDQLRKEKGKENYKDVISLAFGPGLAMEGALLRKVGDF